MNLLSSVFRRSNAHGWLLFSGPSPAIEERALERLLEITNPSSRGLILATGEHYAIVGPWTDDLSALLEIEIDHVDLKSLQPTEFEKYLRDSDLLLCASANLDPWLPSFSQIALPILNEFRDDRNRVCWFVGDAALPMGEWIFDLQQNTYQAGVEWLPGCLVLHEEGDLEDLMPVQDILQNKPFSYALNLVEGATLALGPAGEVDLWGTPPPTIVLGRSWLSS